ncbi:MAG: polyphosphate kinase [Fulvimarina manganoxydans]|uniref:polyphosphate kinase 2 family protein n=1 Tax=Fulvimarina manganoxydans TaxID=937218 RepID=UPI0023551637|nr:polyphosphate kinase [Fulvimarina manganoxydans]MCK5932857.1 polyphosphate kinase [Fulvimarina manganoxydans]
MRLSDLDLSQKLDDETYEAKLSELQSRFKAIQQAYLRSGESAAVVFEGWDAAGKGGAIRRMASVMDPRGFRVWPIGAPSETDKARHYLARFFDRLPASRQIALFDRSWYGRVLVERVEGFASEAEWSRAYDEINAFEAMLVQSGMKLAKVFLYIDRDEQLRRFEKRLKDPVKRWKLSYEDFRNRDKWDEYEVAVDDMIAKTSTNEADWCLVPANDKKFARIAALGHIADSLARDVDISPPPVDPDLLDRLKREGGTVA